MKATEVITAYGHRNILAINAKTFEITRDEHMTKRGDCLVAVAADKSIMDFSEEFQRILRTKGSKLLITIDVGSKREQVDAVGSPKLTLRHSTDIVVRRSDYVCDRTLAIKANKAAIDFSRQMVAALKNPNQKVVITLSAEQPTRT